MKGWSANKRQNQDFLGGNGVFEPDEKKRPRQEEEPSGHLEEEASGQDR